MAAFEEHVRRALDALPPELARGLKNVAVVVEDENTGDPGLLGLFEEAPYLPAKVTIYRRPVQAAFHELAHYFGLDEGRLAELGYA